MACAQQEAQSARPALQTAAEQARQLETGYATLTEPGDRSRIGQVREQLGKAFGEASQLSTQAEKITAGLELLKSGGD